MTDLPPLTLYSVPETPAEIELAIVKIVDPDGFLVASNNLSDVDDPEEARINLGAASTAQGALADTALQSEDIGVTVQGYNSGTVIDPDYNQFSDAEKTKLEGIESGAQVNPDLSSYETTTQLNTRDTNNRNRANHTGTQTAASITDFDTEVSNNTDVAANTSARHDAVTVADSAEIDFTLTGQQITASIVAGSIDESKLDASVNASLDLADSSVQLTGNQSIAGTKTFTTALILPNNSRVNGVEHFYQTTKPTVRGDSTALVVGDRWYNTSDGTEWFWNGTYWLSPTRSISSPAINTLFSTTTPITQIPRTHYTSEQTLPADVFVHSLGLICFHNGGGTNDSSNYWKVNATAYALNGAGTFPSKNITMNLFNQYFALAENFVAAFNMYSFNFSFVKVGSPQVLICQSNLVFSYIG